MTIGLSIVHFVIKVPKLVQMIITIYRVEAYEVPIVNLTWPPKKPRWPPRFFVFVEISKSDRGDFPRIIEIALFLFVFLHVYLPLQILFKILKSCSTSLSLKVQTAVISRASSRSPCFSFIWLLPYINYVRDMFRHTLICFVCRV